MKSATNSAETEKSGKPRLELTEARPKATKANLKARAANGSLLSIIGLVVMKAEDQRSTNIKGNILIIIFNKQIN